MENNFFSTNKLHKIIPGQGAGHEFRVLITNFANTYKLTFIIFLEEIKTVCVRFDGMS